MRITAEISLYPLRAEFVTDIRAFILRLRAEPGLEVVTNQLSTQIRGDFDAVLGALSRTMKSSMAAGEPMVFVTKFLNADLPIAARPAIERDAR